MTNTPQPPDRIPITHSVVYAVRGLPEVPNKHGAGTLEPREITLTYRAAPDSQLGRVHAYVAGRIWVNGAELPLLPGGLYGQHYDDGLDGWPEWLAEEARLHDPAASPAVPVPPTTHATDEERRDRIIPRAVRPLDIEHDQLMARAEAEHQARVVAEQARKATDRAAVLREAADAIEAEQAREETTEWARFGELDHETEIGGGYVRASAALLRRMADEAQQQPGTETPASAEPLASGLPLVKGNCPACRRASLFLGSGGYPTCSNADCPEPDAATTVLEQYANEAHDPEHTWAAELHDPLADEWVPGTRYLARDRAVNALAHAQRIGPTWKDGTPTQRRLVRATTTYTVEQPVPGPGRVADEEPGETGDGPRTVCVCGHTRGEHLTVSGRLLCDVCDPDSTSNLVCRGFEAL